MLNLDLPRVMDRARDDFVIAASLGRMNTGRSFLEAGMHDNTLVRDQRHLSVLMVACMHGQASVAELFSKWMLRWILFGLGISSRPRACCKHASSKKGRPSFA